MALRRLRALLGHVDSADGGGTARREPVAPGQELGPWIACNEDDGTCGASEGYPKWAGLTDLYGDRAAQWAEHDVDLARNVFAECGGFECLLRFSALLASKVEGRGGEGAAAAGRSWVGH